MFGDQDGDHGDEEVAVDTTLESLLVEVETSIDEYLNNPSVELRKVLLTTLERLDQQIDAGDGYKDSISWSGAWGFSDKGSILGETSDAPIVEEIRASELRAQTELVKAAKQEVSSPTADSMTVLRAAKEALVALRGQIPPAQ